MVVSSVPLGTIEVLTAPMPPIVIPVRKAGTKTNLANLYAWHVWRGGTKTNSLLMVVSSVPLGTIEVLTAPMPPIVIPARKAGTNTKLASLYAWHVWREGTK